MLASASKEHEVRDMYSHSCYVSCGYRAFRETCRPLAVCEKQRLRERHPGDILMRRSESALCVGTSVRLLSPRQDNVMAGTHTTPEVPKMPNFSAFSCFATGGVSCRFLRRCQWLWTELMKGRSVRMVDGCCYQGRPRDQETLKNKTAIYPGRQSKEKTLSACSKKIVDMVKVLKWHLLKMSSRE